MFSVEIFVNYLQVDNMSEKETPMVISILLPTRGRREMLKRSIDTLISKAAKPERLEILLGIDEDDDGVQEYLKEEVYRQLTGYVEGQGSTKAASPQRSRPRSETVDDTFNNRREEKLVVKIIPLNNDGNADGNADDNDDDGDAACCSRSFCSSSFSKGVAVMSAAAAAAAEAVAAVMASLKSDIASISGKSESREVRTTVKYVSQWVVLLITMG